MAETPNSNSDSREPEEQEASEREYRFRERMEQLVPTFLEVREKMGIGKEVGFGYLREVHRDSHSLGTLPEIKKTRQGRIKYSVPGSFGKVHQENLPEEERKNILVMPKGERKQRVVSVCDPYEDWDAKLANLIDAPDDIFIGIIAHELAHTFNSKTKFTLEVRNILENRHRKNGGKEKWNYNTNNEEETDIIASLFGYKKEVIAKIDFMIDRFNKMGQYFKNREGVIKSLEVRKQQVLEYCP